MSVILSLAVQLSGFSCRHTSMSPIGSHRSSFLQDATFGGGRLINCEHRTRTAHDGRSKTGRASTIWRFVVGFAKGTFGDDTTRATICFGTQTNGTSSHHSGGAAVLRTFRTRDSDAILSRTDHSCRTAAISTARLQPEVGPGRDARISIKTQVLVIEHRSQEPRDLSAIMNDILRLLQLQMDTVHETTHDCSHLGRKAYEFRRDRLNALRKELQSFQSRRS
jgi:hypothetical protein